MARCHCHLPATFLRFALQMSGILFIRAVSSFFLVATAGAGERKTETEGGGVGGRGGRDAALPRHRKESPDLTKNPIKCR